MATLLIGNSISDVVRFSLWVTGWGVLCVGNEWGVLCGCDMLAGGWVLVKKKMPAGGVCRQSYLSVLGAGSALAIVKLVMPASLAVTWIIYFGFFARYSASYFLLCFAGTLYLVRFVNDFLPCLICFHCKSPFGLLVAKLLT